MSGRRCYLKPSAEGAEGSKSRADGRHGAFLSAPGARRTMRVFFMLLSLAAGAQVTRGAHVQAPSCSSARSLLVLKPCSVGHARPAFQTESERTPGATDCPLLSLRAQPREGAGQCLREDYARAQGQQDGWKGRAGPRDSQRTARILRQRLSSQAPVLSARPFLHRPHLRPAHLHPLIFCCPSPSLSRPPAACTGLGTAARRTGHAHRQSTVATHASRPVLAGWNGR